MTGAEGFVILKITAPWMWRASRFLGKSAKLRFTRVEDERQLGAEEDDNAEHDGHDEELESVHGEHGPSSR